MPNHTKHVQTQLFSEDGHWSSEDSHWATYWSSLQQLFTQITALSNFQPLKIRKAKNPLASEIDYQELMPGFKWFTICTHICKNATFMLTLQHGMLGFNLICQIGLVPVSFLICDQTQVLVQEYRVRRRISTEQFSRSRSKTMNCTLLKQKSSELLVLSQLPMALRTLLWSLMKKNKQNLSR